jgi:predicted nucleic-acid-binding Zn-ribbon protein
MKDGICPKCGSDEIYTGGPMKSFLGVPLVGSTILLSNFKKTNSVRIDLTLYGCSNCGYIESYAADEKSIQNMIDEWQPLKPKRKNDE